MNEEKYFSMMQSKFTYDELMQWDKNDLVEELLGKQGDVEHLLKCNDESINRIRQLLGKLMEKNNDE